MPKIFANKGKIQILHRTKGHYSFIILTFYFYTNAIFWLQTLQILAISHSILAHQLLEYKRTEKKELYTRITNEAMYVVLKTLLLTGRM